MQLVEVPERQLIVPSRRLIVPGGLSQIQPTRTKSRHGIAIIDSGAVDFSPASIPNLLLWLRADQGTDTQVNGAVVTTWNDLSGNGNTASQATVARKPTYVANAFNGRPAVLFAGTDDMMAGALVPNPTREPFTLFAVSQMTLAPQVGGIFDSTTAGGLTNLGNQIIQNNANRSYRYASAADLTYALATTAAPICNIGRVRITGVNQEQKELFDLAVSKGTQNTATVTGTLLTQYRIGEAFQDTSPFRGRIFEIAAYSTNLTAQQIGDLASYASALYGI